MIISASRRTDLPALYSDWLLARLAAGEALVPQPRRPDRPRLISLSPDSTDCLVFWTKNPEPLRRKLPALESLGYRRYYFSFTLTPYGSDLEPNLPPKADLLTGFERLGDQVGPLRLDWRYDPIIVDERHSLQWHLDRFGLMARRLRGRFDRCLISFFKPYRHLGRGLAETPLAEAEALAAGLAGIAAEYSFGLFHCTERLDLSRQGVGSAACIDRAKVEAIMAGRSAPLTGGPEGEPPWNLTSPLLKAKKDPGQPKTCLCLQSVDLGTYNTCVHGCRYCYAVNSQDRARRLCQAHDPAAPALAGP